MGQLTKRENQVLSGVRAGMMDKEVARALGIRPSTVSMHLQRAARKLGANGRIGAVLATLPQPGPLPHTTYERRLLAYMIHGEARGEPLAGMLAVSAGEIDGDVVIEEAPQGRPS